MLSIQWYTHNLCFNFCIYNFSTEDLEPVTVIYRYTFLQIKFDKINVYSTTSISTLYLGTLLIFYWKQEV